MSLSGSQVDRETYNNIPSSLESVSQLGKNIPGVAVVVPDSSDGTAPENPYE